MLIKKSSDIPSSEITPKDVYMNRRKFMAGALAASTGALLGGAVLELVQPGTSVEAGGKIPNLQKSTLSTGEQQTPYKDITTYNNFYEFGTNKDDPSALAKNFRTTPWSVKVEGQVNKPRTFDVDTLIGIHPPQERVFRHRCVEGWSMVIPWVGYSLAEFIKQVEPTSKAKYVEFTTLMDPSQFPGQRSGVLDWPYTEGLRMDEAMHPLATLCFGLYGETLPNQDGAPVRLVVPWKYGFKSIKSIVKIRFTESQPATAWNKQAPQEYGFYSNVNPQVDHPRWSQKKERRIGDFFKRPTLMFNGYGDQVASLYSGMDLRKYF